MRRFLPISLLLILMVIGLREIAAQQYGLRNPGFLASLQSGAAAGTWSSNNMTLWVVAEDLTGTANNAAPLLWTNRIPVRCALTNTTGTAVVKSNSVVNGKAALFFDGSGGSLASINPVAGGVTSTNWDAWVASDQCMIFFVMRQRSAQAQNTLWQWANTDLLHGYATYEDVLYFDYKDTTANRISAAQPVGWDNTWHVLTYYRATGGSAAIRVDGVDVATGTMANALTDTGSIPWLIGSGSAGFFNGDIAEIRMFNVYSAGEITLNEQDLDASYTP